MDELTNIQFWVRCRERQEDSFALQGWENRNIYPDFAALTKKDNILVFEWNGEDRKDNPDTEYKKALGKVWEQLGKGKLHFFLVHNENVNEVLAKVKQL